MSRVASLLALLSATLVAVPCSARTLALPVRDAAHPDVAAPAYLGDRLVLRLRPDAARLARRATRAVGERVDGVGLAGVDAAARRYSARLERALPDAARPVPGGADLGAYWVVRLAPGSDLGEALDAFAAQPEVELAEPDAVCPVTALPDDSLWSTAWYLFQPSRHDVHAPEAWAITTGDSTIPVAVLDTGILRDHPDLGGTVPGGWGNLWTNARELNGQPGVDDDGDGYVDDVWGMDFVDVDSSDVTPGEDWRDVDNDPNDFAGHGTAVASVIGALTNNGIGVAGALWQTRLMAVRVGWSSPRAPLGEVDMVAAARGMQWAAYQGAKVINCSFATVLNSLLYDALNYALSSGATVVVAAGNNGSPNYLELDPRVVSVTACDQNDVLTLFSNRSSYAALAAPGVDMDVAIVHHTRIDSTDTDSLRMRTPAYSAGAAGTSFSAPLVSAAAAMVYAVRKRYGLPPPTPAEVRDRLVSTTDDISALNPGGAYGSGRLNMARALTAVQFAEAPFSTTAIPVGSTSVGDPLALPTTSGDAHAMTVLADGRLEYFDYRLRAPVVARALGAAPAGGMAGADMGGSVGDALFVPLANGTLAGLDLGYRPLPGWPVAVPPIVPGNGGAAPLALGDLTGGDSLSVVWGGSDGRVYAWDAHGVPRAGFPRALAGAGASIDLALDDLDGAPGAEIVAHAGDGGLHVLRADGSEAPGWPYAVGTPDAPPVVAHAPPPLDGPRVVCFTTRGGSPTALVFDGAGRMTQSVALPARITGPAAVGELDGDSTDEVVVPLVGGPAAFTIADGTTGPPRWRSASLLATAGPLLIGPLLQFGAPGVLCPEMESDGSVHFATLDDTGMEAFPRTTGRSAGQAMIGDLDRNGYTDAFAGADAFGQLAYIQQGAAFWHPVASVWPAARGGFARTGSVRYTPALAPQDDQPPQTIRDLRTYQSTPSSLMYGWGAPPDTGSTGGVASYEMRLMAGRSFEWVLAAKVAGVPAPAAPGTRQYVTVPALAESSAYVVAIQSTDRVGNVSAPSNVLLALTRAIPPDPVGGLAIVGMGDTSLTLRWVATGDDHSTGRPVSYEVVASPDSSKVLAHAAGVRAWAFPATVDAGGLESRRVTGFVPGSRWWFAVRATDHVGATSQVSNLLAATLSGGPPAPVGDLVVSSVGDTSVTLSWTAVTDDGESGHAEDYELRAAPDSIGVAGFATAPRAWSLPARVAAGQREVRTLGGFAPDQRWWFAMQALDRAGNASAVSTAVRTVTSGLPPAPVRDLRVTLADDSTVTVTFAATADDGESHHAARYRLRAAQEPLDDAGYARAPREWVLPGGAPAGAPMTATLRGFRVGETWWFAARAEDLGGNDSALSPSVAVVIGYARFAGRTDAVVAPAVTPSRGQVALLFQAAAGDGAVASRIDIFDVGGRRVRTIELGAVRAGTATWDGADEHGSRVPSGVYFARYASGASRSITRIVYLR